MNYILDTHIHTIACGHAFSTVWEIAKVAKERDLKLIAITEHSLLADNSFFSTIRRLPSFIEGVEVLSGAEVDILNSNGELALPDSKLEKLSVVIASFHIDSIAPCSKEENTKTLLKVMQNRNVGILGHIDDKRFEIDFDIITREAGKEGVIIEINNSSLISISRKTGKENILNLLRSCLKHKCYITLASDAHNAWNVGDFSKIESLIEEVNYPKELIVNTDAELFKRVIGERRHNES